jgi:hypothetical protein
MDNDLHLGFEIRAFLPLFGKIGNPPMFDNGSSCGAVFPLPATPINYPAAGSGVVTLKRLNRII